MFRKFSFTVLCLALFSLASVYGATLTDDTFDNGALGTNPGIGNGYSSVYVIDGSTTWIDGIADESGGRAHVYTDYVGTPDDDTYPTYESAAIGSNTQLEISYLYDKEYTIVWEVNDVSVSNNKYITDPNFMDLRLFFGINDDPTQTNVQNFISFYLRQNPNLNDYLQVKGPSGGSTYLLNSLLSHDDFIGKSFTLTMKINAEGISIDAPEINLSETAKFADANIKMRDVIKSTYSYEGFGLTYWDRDPNELTRLEGDIEAYLDRVTVTEDNWTPSCDLIKADGFADDLSFDINGDCYVNLLDFAEFAESFLDCYEPTDGDCSKPWAVEPEFVNTSSVVADDSADLDTTGTFEYAIAFGEPAGSAYNVDGLVFDGYAESGDIAGVTTSTASNDYSRATFLSWGSKGDYQMTGDFDFNVISLGAVSQPDVSVPLKFNLDVTEGQTYKIQMVFGDPWYRNDRNINIIAENQTVATNVNSHTAGATYDEKVLIVSTEFTALDSTLNIEFNSTDDTQGAMIKAMTVEDITP